MEKVHGNVARWSVTATEDLGEHSAPIATSTVTHADGVVRTEVSVYVSPIDGLVVVQVDTFGDRSSVRVTVDDCLVFGAVPEDW